MNTKPLGMKAYGSIPHLPGSRLGPGEHTISDGQARMCTEQAKHKSDIVFVTEKLDGSNCSVAKIGDKIVALGRAGYEARSSQYEQHRMFADWVDDHIDNFQSLLEPGERVCGEWLAMAHGTRYRIERGFSPFFCFDIMRQHVRTLSLEMFDRCKKAEVATVHPLWWGKPITIEKVMDDLADDNGYHGAIDLVEGAVWRVERKGKFCFIAKYVRPGKVDGTYFSKNTGKPEVWNWRPESEAK